MRGGTSKGPFFNAKHLPKKQSEIKKILMKVIDAGHKLNINGIGGGNAVSTKVAIIAKSKDKWADVDYLFAQVAVEKKQVDFSPTCGNMLAAVAPAAIEMGIIKPKNQNTNVKIKSVNTGALVQATVKTPNKKIQYDGKTKINGVNGTAAPIKLNFKNIIGAKTGNMFPTGKKINVIDKIKITCIDVAMPMVIAKATDFGITGYESQKELDQNKTLFKKIEKIRIKAGKIMGMGNVTKSVVPKFALIAKPKKNGNVTARYFMPWSTHPAYAVTGAIATGACIINQQTIAEGIAKVKKTKNMNVKIEHPTGEIDVVFEINRKNNEIINAGVIRTARKLFSGNVHI